jgi:hypothetical protein
MLRIGKAIRFRLAAALLDPAATVRYIGRYTKRAVLG